MNASLSVFTFLIVFGTVYAASACGDGICNLSAHENCEKCVQDCKCPNSSRCEPEPDFNPYTEEVYMENQSLGCVHIANCGDGFCDFDTPAKYNQDNIRENCANCPTDCACGVNWSDWGYSRYQGPPGIVRQPSGPYEYCDMDPSSWHYASCVAVSYCGDSRCDWDNKSEFNPACKDCPETCVSCPEDCDCKELLGKGGVCDFNLSNANSVGCGVPAICGDGRCDQKTNDKGINIGEDCHNCAKDCGCDSNQSCEETDIYGYACIAPSSGPWAPCPQGYCWRACGDGFCYPMEGEDCTTCVEDCACSEGMTCHPNTSGQDAKGCVPASASSCGDGTCGGSEDCTSCPMDCDCSQEEHPETELFCSDGVDEDRDGVTDCADSDCAFNPKCVAKENQKAADSIKNAFLDDLKSRSKDTTALENLALVYSDRPELMTKEMNKYMVENVYFPERMDSYLKIFETDPQKQQALRDIAASNADPFERELALQAYTYQNCISCAEQKGLVNYIADYALNPPKWLYGGTYGTGGALDWSDFATKNIIRLGKAVGKPVSPMIESYGSATTVVIAVYDAKDLLDKSAVIAETNIGDREKVGLVVLDGSLKIAKILDPTGYFGNLGDATVGKVIEVSKQISDRNQGYFGWEGRVLHQEADGAYVDINSNERFTRVPGGFTGGATFVPAG